MNKWLKSRRERLLFLMVLWSVTFILLLYSWRGWGQYRIELRTERAERASYLQTIGLKDEIAEELQRVLDDFDTRSTPNLNEFIQIIDTMVRELRLEPDLSQPQTRESDFFRFHQLQVSFRRVSMSDLVRFQNELESRLPFVTIESLSIVPSRTDPNQLDATFRLRSIELMQESLTVW